MVETGSDDNVERRVDALRVKALADPKLLPALASALLDRSRSLQQDDRDEEAIDAAREGIEALSAMFVKDPGTCRDEMYALVTQYTLLCSHSSTPPDETLLAPIAAAFGREME